MSQMNMHFSLYTISVPHRIWGKVVTDIGHSAHPHMLHP